MSDLTIAKTIVSQIIALDKWALGAWGVSEKIGTDEGLYMKVRGPKFKGRVAIMLDFASDTYTVTTYKRDNTSVIEEIKDVHAEELINLLDRIIG